MTMSSNLSQFLPSWTPFHDQKMWLAIFLHFSHSPMWSHCKQLRWHLAAKSNYKPVTFIRSQIHDCYLSTIFHWLGICAFRFRLWDFSQIHVKAFINCVWHRVSETRYQRCQVDWKIVKWLTTGNKQYPAINKVVIFGKSVILWLILRRFGEKYIW